MPARNWAENLPRPRHQPGPCVASLSQQVNADVPGNKGASRSDFLTPPPFLVRWRRVGHECLAAGLPLFACVGSTPTHAFYPTPTCPLLFPIPSFLLPTFVPLLLPCSASRLLSCSPERCSPVLQSPPWYPPPEWLSCVLSNVDRLFGAGGGAFTFLTHHVGKDLCDDHAKN